MAAQPGLEHERDLVQRARALVVWWDQEQDPLRLAGARRVAHVAQARRLSGSVPNGI
jgi:hypothetical protein